jgi:hypothetical protein
MTTSIIVFIVYVVIQLAAKIKEASQTKDASPPPAPGDLSQDERTRRIQAEIRRKIQERTGGGRPAPEPGLVRGQAREMVAREKPPMAPVEERPAEPEPWEPDPEVERQRRLAEQLALLAARRTRAEEPAFAVTRDEGFKPASPESPQTLRENLRAPGSLRRAIVLREILDVPVGLR